MSPVVALPNRKADPLVGELVDAHDCPRRDQLASLLKAEREFSSLLWGVLHELRLHGALPDWARKLDGGTDRQWEAMMKARADLSRAISSLLADQYGGQPFFAARYRTTTEG